MINYEITIQHNTADLDSLYFNLDYSTLSINVIH